MRFYDRVLSASEAATLAVDPTYYAAVTGTSGLAGYWRLGESVTSSDTFTGTAGATLQSRNGEIGATWTKHPSSSADAVLTGAGRLRKAGTSTLGALYYTSAVPASADYTVGADVRMASSVANDMAGVVGRLDPSNTNGTYYIARYEQRPQTVGALRVVNGTWTWLGQLGRAGAHRRDDVPAGPVHDRVDHRRARRRGGAGLGRQQRDHRCRTGRRRAGPRRGRT